MKRSPSPTRRGFNLVEMVLCFLLLLASGIVCWYLHSRFGSWRGFAVFLGAATIYPITPLVLAAKSESGPKSAVIALVVGSAVVTGLWFLARLGGALFGAWGSILAPISIPVSFAVIMATFIELFPVTAVNLARRQPNTTTRPVRPADQTGPEDRAPTKKATDSSAAP